MSALRSSAYHMSFSLRSDVETIDPSLAPSWVSEIRVTQYIQVATAAALVYDAIITMDKEIKYFWKIPRNMVNFVYFANRYIGIFGAIATLLCKFSQWTFDVSNWVVVILMDYILMIRVLALYSQDRKLSICLKTLLALEISAIFGISVYVGLLENIDVGRLAADATVCEEDVDDEPWQLGLVSWMIPMVYGIILLILSVRKAAEYWKMSTGFKGFTLVKVVVQDQILYFVLAVSYCIFNIADFAVTNDSVASILSVLGSASFLCMLGSRMLFNLKEAGERGQNEGTNCRITSRTVSDMEFATHPGNAGAALREEESDNRGSDSAQVSEV